MRRALPGLLAAALVLAAGAPARAAPALTVFAAADLALAFRELVPRAEAALGVRVTLVLGSSGNLTRQIEQGAPADLFFAADQTYVDRLVAEGLVRPETRTVYARGVLVLATPRGARPRLAALPELLGPGVRHVAIANPLHAPYGRAAEEALRRAGVWDALRPKLVYGENVQHALQFVQTGAVEAAIVARSLAQAADVDWTPVDPALHAPLDQAAAVVRRSGQPDRAAAFLGFVSGSEGQAILRRHGFLTPGGA